MGKLLLGSLFGAIICVTWGAISWMVLQWHESTLHKFADETGVAVVLKSNVEDVLKLRGQTAGIFLLPHTGSGTERTPREDTTARKQAAQKAVVDGPFVYAVVRPGPRDVNMGLNIGFGAARSFAACFLIAMLLSWTMRLDYLQRVFFCAMAGLFAGLVTDVPMMIWFEAPLRHTLINLADHLCEWFLAGLAIAAFVPGREVWEKFR